MFFFSVKQEGGNPLFQLNLSRIRYLVIFFGFAHVTRQKTMQMMHACDFSIFFGCCEVLAWFFVLLVLARLAAVGLITEHCVYAIDVCTLQVVSIGPMRYSVSTDLQRLVLRTAAFVLVRWEVGCSVGLRSARGVYDCTD